MPPRRTADPAKTRAAVLAVEQWLRDGDAPEPARPQIAEAVRHFGLGLGRLLRRRGRQDVRPAGTPFHQIQLT